MRPLVGLVWLSGCASDPITNALFYEDETFLVALPDREDLAAPALLEEPPAGDSALLGLASVAARDLDALLAPLVASAQAVRAEAPDGRTDGSRTWDTLLVAATTESGVQTWVIGCQVVRPDDGGPLTWEMTRAESAGDELLPWATGDWIGGRGTITMALSDGETLDLAWTPPTTEAPDREVDLEVLGPSGIPTDRAWALYGADRIAWQGTFEVTGDAEPWPGWAVATHTASGGRSAGQVQRGEETLQFESCWDAGGDAVWQGGDPDVTVVGDRAACTVPELPSTTP